MSDIEGLGINRPMRNNYRMIRRDLVSKNTFQNSSKNESVLKIPRYANVEIAPNTIINIGDIIYTKDNENLYYHNGERWLGILTDNYEIPVGNITNISNTITSNDINLVVNITNSNGNSEIVSLSPQDLLCLTIQQGNVYNIDNTEIYVTGEEDGNCVVIKSDIKDVLCRTTEFKDASFLNTVKDSIKMFISNDSSNCIVTANVGDVICKTIPEANVEIINQNPIFRLLSTTSSTFDNDFCETVKTTVSDALCKGINLVFNQFDITSQFSKVQFLGTRVFPDGECDIVRYEPRNGSLVYGANSNGFTELVAPIQNSYLTSELDSGAYLPKWRPDPFNSVVTKIIRFRPDDRNNDSDDFFLLAYATWTKIGNINMLHISNSSKWQKVNVDFDAFNPFGSLVSEECMQTIFPGLVLPDLINFRTQNVFPAYPAAPYPDVGTVNGFPPPNIVCNYTNYGSDGFPETDNQEPDRCYPSFNDNDDAVNFLTATCETSTTIYGTSIGFAQLISKDNDVYDTKDSGSIRIYQTVEAREVLGLVGSFYWGGNIIGVPINDSNPKFKSFTFNWIEYNPADATDSITGLPPNTTGSGTRPFDPC